MTAVESKHGGANVRLPPPLVFLALIGVGVATQWFVGPMPLPLAVFPRAIAGSAVLLAGLAIVLLAGFGLKRTGQDPAPWKPSPELVLRGLYRYTRNPMYVGMTSIQLGTGIAVGNLWITALAPVALLVVHLTAVRPEEAYLEAKFGDSYTRYKRSVRRYL